VSRFLCSGSHSLVQLETHGQENQNTAWRHDVTCMEPTSGNNTAATIRRLLTCPFTGQSHVMSHSTEPCIQLTWLISMTQIIDSSTGQLVSVHIHGGQKLHTKNYYLFNTLIIIITLRDMRDICLNKPHLLSTSCINVNIFHISVNSW